MAVPIPNQDSLVKELREKIAAGDVVIIVGAGVSIGATEGHATASWKGLLEHGLKHCETIGKLQPEEAEAFRVLLKGEMMLSVAEAITKCLEAPEGEYAAWLNSVFHEDHYPRGEGGVIKVIDKLDCPIVTTNYDGLIEHHTKRSHAVWSRDEARLGLIMQGRDCDVFHVHGFWKAPESIVLGIRDYQSVKDHAHTHAFMRAISFGKSLLFVGCGEGMDDPHFKSLLEWLSASKCKLPDRSYRLALSKDVKTLQKTHPLKQRMMVLSYGEKHKDLAPFLSGLVPKNLSSKALQSQALSPAWTEYLGYLTRETATMPLAGLGSGITVSLPIADAYIPLRTCQVERFADKGGAEKYEPDEAKQRDLLLVDLFKQSPRPGVLLLGSPGAGKTTGLRQWCWRLASGEALAEDFGLPARCLPVFLKLRNLPAANDTFSKDPTQFFVEFLFSEVRVPKAMEADIVMEKELRDCQAPLLWLVDGLDEVADEEIRKAVFVWLTDLLSERDCLQDRMLIAGRYQGVEGVIERGDAFSRFEVQPLAPEQSREFVRKWFETTYARLNESPEKAQKKSKALIAVLDSEAYRFSKLKTLKSNPLLLTILCVVFHEDASLPEERAKVYDRCMGVMLDSWRKEMSTRYDSAAARAVLGRVAWWLHGEVNRRAAPLVDLESYAEAQLSAYPNAKLPGTGHDFIGLMKDHAGVMAALGDGQAEFLHLTFQEYLAADHAARENLGAELADQLAVPWWREVILLALSQGSLDFSRKFFAPLIANQAVKQDPTFFEECLRAAQVVSWDLFAEALRKGTDAKRLPLLKAIRGFAVPEILEVARELAVESKSKELRSLAKDLLRGSEAAPSISEEDTEWTHPETGMVFVRIPAGTFVMGSPEDEENRGSDETQHEVTLSEDYWMAKYPVTNNDYEVFVRATKHREPGVWDETRFNQPSQPVVGVDWDDAVAFSQWLGGKLPSEAQWEYACRAGTRTPFAIGNGEDLSSKEANFDGHYPYGKAKKGPYLKQTSPVGTYEPNPWALYDMHGNVLEWCEDWLADYPSGPMTDPAGPRAGQHRVLRGGCWGDDGRRCRSADRFGSGPGDRGSRVGFRPVLGRSFPGHPSGASPARQGQGKGAPQAERGERP